MYVFNAGELRKYTTGVAGTVQVRGGCDGDSARNISTTAPIRSICACSGVLALWTACLCRQATLYTTTYFQGKCVKKCRIDAAKLKLISAKTSLLAIRTAKTRSLVSINKETLIVETTFKMG